MKKILPLLVFVAGLAACTSNNSNNNNAQPATDDSAASANAQPLSPRQQSEEVMFDRYLDLKNALVAAKPTEASAAANGMLTVLDTLKVSTDTAAWNQDKVKMKSDLGKIITGTKIGDMRAGFSAVSDDYYNAIGKYGIYTKRAYREYCPMAFDSKGAYWLSTSQKIENPYFGKDMIDCGEVKDTL
jgi:Cu(I)/Ag(I) efflux system membrane fusion protein